MGTMWVFFSNTYFCCSDFFSWDSCRRDIVWCLKFLVWGKSILIWLWLIFLPLRSYEDLSVQICCWWTMTEALGEGRWVVCNDLTTKLWVTYQHLKNRICLQPKLTFTLELLSAVWEETTNISHRFRSQFYPYLAGETLKIEY